MSNIDRFRGCLLGLAVGDAVGTTVEFHARGSFEPLTDMVGGGPFGLLPGQWTDDTSMALCLATSLLEQHGFNARDQMMRYCAWMDRGYWSSTGTCFDIGGTVASALRHFKQTGEPYAGSSHPRSAGNGCIMRLAPIPMFFYPDLNAVEHYGAESSKTTHGASECIDACRLFSRIVARALDGQSMVGIASDDAESFAGAERIVSIARGSYRTKQAADIRGSGYVVDCLEAAMWCFIHSRSFEEAVLMAANLGDDADTTASVCGQVAGAHYGASRIPARWLERLALRFKITDIADRLCSRRGTS